MIREGLILYKDDTMIIFGITEQQLLTGFVLINITFLKVLAITFLDHFSKFTPTRKLEYSTKCLCDVLPKKVTVRGYMTRLGLELDCCLILSKLSVGATPNS